MIVMMLMTMTRPAAIAPAMIIMKTIGGKLSSETEIRAEVTMNIYYSKINH